LRSVLALDKKNAPIDWNIVAKNAHSGMSR